MPRILGILWIWEGPKGLQEKRGLYNEISTTKKNDDARIKVGKGEPSLLWDDGDAGDSSDDSWDSIKSRYERSGGKKKERAAVAPPDFISHN